MGTPGYCMEPARFSGGGCLPFTAGGLFASFLRDQSFYKKPSRPSMDQGTEASTEMELLFTSDRGGFIFPCCGAGELYLQSVLKQMRGGSIEKTDVETSTVSASGGAVSDAIVVSGSL